MRKRLSLQAERQTDGQMEAMTILFGLKGQGVKIRNKNKLLLTHILNGLQNYLTAQRNMCRHLNSLCLFLQLLCRLLDVKGWLSSRVSWWGALWAWWLSDSTPLKRKKKSNSNSTTSGKKFQNQIQSQELQAWWWSALWAWWLSDSTILKRSNSNSSTKWDIQVRFHILFIRERSHATINSRYITVKYKIISYHIHSDIVTNIYWTQYHRDKELWSYFDLTKDTHISIF